MDTQALTPELSVAPQIVGADMPAVPRKQAPMVEHNLLAPAGCRGWR